MNKLLLIISGAVLSVFLSGCGSVYSGKMYEPHTNPSDPVLSFSSDYEYYTKFWINGDSPAEKRQCKNTDEIGFLLLTDSIFVFDKPVLELATSVPAGKEITITGSTYKEGFSCGPIHKVFTPEKGKNYLIHFEKAGKYCRMNITEEKSNKEVENRTVAFCVK